MSDLGFNKIAAAVLATGLAVAGLAEVSAMMFEPHEAETPGYLPEVVTGPPDPNEVVLPPDWGTLIPVADIAAGQVVFAKCASCHKVTDENGTGPGLAGVVGRRPAGHAGFDKYSSAIQTYAGANPQWTFDELDAFLTNPRRHIDGTNMSFVGLRNQEERVNVIAYLHSLGSSLPVPAPDPSRQPQPAAAEGEVVEGEAAAEGEAAPAEAEAAPAAH